MVAGHGRGRRGGRAVRRREIHWQAAANLAAQRRSTPGRCPGGTARVPAWLWTGRLTDLIDNNNMRRRNFLKTALGGAMALASANVPRISLGQDTVSAGGGNPNY